MRLRLDDEGREEEGHGGGPTPSPADALTARLLAAEPRIGTALRRWIEGECEAFERAGGCRSVPYEQRKEPLGDSGFERAVLAPTASEEVTFEWGD